MSEIYRPEAKNYPVARLVGSTRFLSIEEIYETLEEILDRIGKCGVAENLLRDIEEAKKIIEEQHALILSSLSELRDKKANTNLMEFCPRHIEAIREANNMPWVVLSGSAVNEENEDYGKLVQETSRERERTERALDKWKDMIQKDRAIRSLG